MTGLEMPLPGADLRHSRQFAHGIDDVGRRGHAQGVAVDDRAGMDMSSILTAPVGPVTTTCLSSMWRKNTSVESSSTTSCAAIVPAHASSRIERYDFIL